MLIISLQNIENIIFTDKKLRKKLPTHKNEFYKWDFSIRNAGFKSMGLTAILEVLNSLSGEDLLILKNYFDQDVEIEKMATNLVKNYSDQAECLEYTIADEYFNNFLLFRKNDTVDITFWR
jgi:hypothetical protein